MTSIQPCHIAGKYICLREIENRLGESTTGKVALGGEIAGALIVYVCGINNLSLSSSAKILPGQSFPAGGKLVV